MRWPRHVGWVIELRRMRLIVVIGTLLGMLLAGVMASPAFASAVDNGFAVVPAGPFSTNACGFPINVTPVTNKEHSTILSSSGQSVVTLVAGPLKVSFTNPETGKTITEDISGSAKETRTEFDTSGLAHLVTTVAAGRTLLIIHPGPGGTFGFPPVSVTAGALTTVWAAHEGLDKVTLQGRIVVNVCAALS